MKLHLSNSFLTLILVILFSQKNEGNPNRYIELESIKDEFTFGVDSIYIKFDLNSEFNLDILSNKAEQIFVTPDTNYRAYYFDAYSSLFYFPIPIEVIYPICSGDSLIISSKNFMPYITIVNNQKYSEREVNFVSELSSKNLNVFEYLYKQNGTPENALKATLSYLDSLVVIGELSEEYKDWLNNNAEFSYLKLTQVKKIKTSPIDINDKINIDKNLYYRYYQAFLWKRMDMLLNEDYKCINKIIQIANSNFKGECKDYVLYQFAIEHLSIINSNQAKLSISELEGCFTDDEYLTILKYRYLAKYNVEADNVDQLLQSNGETVSFEKMLEKYRGRKIYIDVWASWCAPCRVEMQSSRALKKELDEKNITFVYLSIDKVQNHWLKANKEEKLGDCDSYLIIDPLKSRFMLKYKIDAIPRYFLLDEKGIVINEDAPRPSSEKIRETLKM